VDAVLYTPVVDSLERAPSLVVPLAREVPEAVRKRRPGPARWSAHEHACHLAAVHPLFFERLDLMLSHEHPTIRPYLPDQDDPPDALLRVDLDEALERFGRDRAALVSRLRSLLPSDWDRTAEHAEYSRYSVFVMFRHLALHDLLHSYRIEELLLKRDWPER
jgi:DinB family protein